jgi:hypothetical protein
MRDHRLAEAIVAGALFLGALATAAEAQRGGRGGGGHMGGGARGGMSGMSAGGAQGGGMGGGGMGGSAGHSVRASAPTSIGGGNGAATGDRGNFSGNNTNIHGGNTNININGGDRGYGWDDHYHPIAAGVAIGATAAVTSAVVGSMLYTLPPACNPYPYASMTFYSCGGVYYQPQYQGSTVTYVVVDRPG